jgi:hypothetical protein
MLFSQADQSHVQYSIPSATYNTQHQCPNPNQWREAIIQHVCILNKAALTEEFASSYLITIVSDGGAHHYEGNFGLAIADNSKVLVTNMGKLYSIDFYESSHRSEIYGVLASLVTIKYLIIEQQIKIPHGKQIHMFCDNASVPSM